MCLSEVPVEFLREVFHYCPDTGAIRHKRNTARAKAGDVVGYVNRDGYREIKVMYDGRRYTFMGHRLAVALHEGAHPPPDLDVDHRDRDRQNNRYLNLRVATRSNNLANRPASGPLPKGVTRSKTCVSKPFMAQISVRGRKFFLGYHPTAEEAHAAYVACAREHFGEFVRL
jgi:hypothetical protein